MCFILQYCCTWGGGGSEVSGGCVSSCSTAVHGGVGGGGPEISGGCVSTCSTAVHRGGCLK